MDIYGAANEPKFAIQPAPEAIRNSEFFHDYETDEAIEALKKIGRGYFLLRPSFDMQPAKYRHVFVVSSWRENEPAPSETTFYQKADSDICYRSDYSIYSREVQTRGAGKLYFGSPEHVIETYKNVYKLQGVRS